MPSHDPHGQEPAADMTIRALDTPLGPTILLDRPARRNALTLPMWQALGARVLELAAGTSGPVYLMGAGGYFSSGADLGSLAWARSSEEQALEFVEGVVTCLLRLHLADREIVAVVEGGAAGGGVEIMAACDRRVAIGAPRLVFPFGQHGMELDGLTRWRLTKLVGEAEAERLVDGRHVVEADEAARLGLFDQQHGSLEELAAAESAREIGASGPAGELAGEIGASAPAGELAGEIGASGPAGESAGEIGASGPAGESAREIGASGPADEKFTLAGEDFAAAVARASVPMLQAFPPHRTG